LERRFCANKERDKEEKTEEEMKRILREEMERKRNEEEI